MSKTDVLIKEENSSSLSTPTKNILLIGSTGVGKSSLGNFLINPKNNLPFFPFETSGGFKSCTFVIQTRHLDYECEQRKHHINIIDTPGLNESNSSNDVENMLNIVKTLNSLIKINLIII